MAQGFKSNRFIFALIVGVVFAGCNPGDTALRTKQDGQTSDEAEQQQSDATAPRSITGTNLANRDNVAVAASWDGNPAGVLAMRVRVRLKPGVFVNADGFAESLAGERTTFVAEVVKNGVSKKILCPADRNFLMAKCSLNGAVPIRASINLFDSKKNEDFSVGQPILSILSLTPSNGPTAGGTAVNLQLSSPPAGAQLALRFGSNLCSSSTSTGSIAKCGQTPAAAQAGPQPVKLEMDYGNVIITSLTSFLYEGSPSAPGGSGGTGLVHLLLHKPDGSGAIIRHKTYDQSTDVLLDHGPLTAFGNDKVVAGGQASVLPSSNAGGFVSLAIAPQADGLRSWNVSGAGGEPATAFDLPNFGNNWQTYAKSSPASVEMEPGLVSALHLIFADNMSTQRIEIFRSYVVGLPAKIGYLEDTAWTGNDLNAFRSLSIGKNAATNTAFVSYVHPTVDTGASPPQVRDYILHVGVADLLNSANPMIAGQELSASFALKVSQASMIAEPSQGPSTKLHFALVAEGTGPGALGDCYVYYASVIYNGSTFSMHQKKPLWKLTNGTCSSSSPEFNNPIYRPQIIKAASGITIAGMHVKAGLQSDEMAVATVKSDAGVLTWSSVEDLPPLAPYSSTGVAAGRFFLIDASGSDAIVTASNYTVSRIQLWTRGANGSWPSMGKQLLEDSTNATLLIGATIK